MLGPTCSVAGRPHKRSVMSNKITPFPTRGEMLNILGTTPALF